MKYLSLAILLLVLAGVPLAALNYVVMPAITQMHDVYSNAGQTAEGIASDL